jgi:hypothetical protein
MFADTSCSRPWGRCSFNVQRCPSRTKPDFSPLDFHQRFVGSIGDDGATIDGEWQSSDGGYQWTRDFRLTDTRIGTVRDSP